MATQDSESRDLDKVMLRLPDGMRAEIKDAAKSNSRSMNAEIVARLNLPAMSLRDWFAGQALTGLVASPATDGGTWSAIAAAAYKIADAMLEARK